ncbi:YwiC-like family protein [Bacillus smithii]|uniref:YwiC-like family protein n=1 Tax=Bacillus smithii TaxID=1479 RepID=UPI002E21EAA6|nr:YwiC-like family protein [Bacillus smithii]
MSSTKKWLIPKQHGAWAMLTIPFFLGAYAGGFTWLHIPLFIGWLALYLATYPLLTAIKLKRKEYLPWFYRYSVVAVLMFVIPIYYQVKLLYFGIAMVPFFIINIYYARKKKERDFVNDVAAITSFCIGGLASFYMGNGQFTMTALELFMFCFLFFIGSTFYVKTMIREKNNPVYKWLSWGYHLLLIIGLIYAHYPLFVLAYIPSVTRAFYLYGKSLPIKKIGLSEFANAIYFFAAMLLLFHV